VADVQVAVGFGRETGLDGAMFAAFEVFFDDGADEMVVGELVFIKHGLGYLKIMMVGRILPESAGGCQIRRSLKFFR